ncbi:hypothetical protein HGRIS_003600 [Hohenbuehelia grisea]|uniref:SAM-dependent MTase RsmB/NOP-type domain-containing protein n=1 Tax=Hohenbuehelia grisea TaxID=104357 RepID=A0ABR3JFY9_9AGAR
MNFYFEAAKILDRLDAKEGSVKGMLGSLPDKDRKRTAALVIETLKFRPALTDIIHQSKLLQAERKKITTLNLALVLVHDVLLSKGIQAGSGPVKEAILRHKTRLNAELQKLKIKKGVQRNEDLAQQQDQRAERIPRYVRVNTHEWTAKEAIASYTSKGFTLSGPFESSKGFCSDEHIPNLLQFAPRTLFHDDEAYNSGKVILQDKASCFPAAILDPPASDAAVVIDATAAPGNKTSHLSALMGNRGKLYAFERDRRRFSTLTKMLSNAQCKNVSPVNADFLTVDPLDPSYASVTHILLDPSCSGSGIVNRMDYLVEQESENETEQADRLQKLAKFQLLMIKHAMKFPSVHRIVYSTCSIHAIENEHVVRDALKSDEACTNNFRLAPRDQVLPTWPRRGLPGEMDDPDLAASLVRCAPGEDATNGFFVSCFVRSVSDASSSGGDAQGHKRKGDPLDVEPGSGHSKKKKKKRKVAH